MVTLPAQRFTPTPRIRSARRTQWMRLLPAILAPIFGTGLLSPRHAPANDWISTSGGIFGGSAFWSGGVPGPGGLANFALTNTYTVSFNSNPSNGSLTLSAGNVTFRTSDVNPQTYTLTSGTSISGGSLTLGQGLNGQPLTLAAGSLTIATASMFVNANNDLTTTTFNLATSGTGSGFLTIDNSNFTASGSTFMGLIGGTANLTFQNGAIGSFADISMANSSFANSSGHLTVQSGAAAIASGNLLIGPAAVAGQNSTILVDGTASSFIQTGATSLTLGGTAASTASISLTNGGVFSTGTGAITINKTGTINITNGTFNANGNVTLTGGSLSVGLGSNFNLAPGQNLTAQNGASVSFTHNVVASEGAFVPAGSIFTIQSGAHLSSNDYFDIGDEIDSPSPAVATLIVDGSGSSFSASDDPFWGGDGGSASVTIRNNATASVNSLLEIARTTSAGTTGTLNIQSGAQLTVAGHLRLAADGGNATGSIFITDATLTQTSGALILGNSSGTGTASLTINNATGNGGTFTSSTGGISINKNATVNVSHGIFNANGSVNIDGGSLQVGGASNFVLAQGKNLTAQNGASVSYVNASFVPAGSTFTIQTGAHLSSGSFFDVGNAAETGIALATLIVDGSGSSFTAAGTPFWGADGGSGMVTIRNNATAFINSGVTIAGGNLNGTSGVVNVQSGALLTVNGGISLASDGGNATASIFITDATLTQTSGALILGNNAGTGPATLTINNATGNGGTFISSTGGITLNKNATINVTKGSFNANGSITIDGGSLLVASAGGFNLASGNNLTAQNNATITISQPFYTPADGSTFTIQSSSHFTVVDFVAGFNGLHTTLIVDGPGSSFVETHGDDWGSESGSAVVTFRNNATASIPSLFLATSNIGGTSGIVNVLSGAQLTISGNIGLAPQGGNATASIFITDASITQTSGNLILGNSAHTGPATLTINNATGNGGTFTSSTGGITINKDAAININYGTFNANGNVTIDGGTLFSFIVVNFAGFNPDNSLILVSGTFFNLAAGKTLTASNSASVTMPAFYVLPGGSTFTIQSGSHFSADAEFNVGNAASSNANLATLIIDGTGSSFSAFNAGFGASGGSGSVTIRNNATAAIATNGGNELDIAASTITGTSGILQVQSGAQLTVGGNIRLAADGGNATGNIFITDALITQTSGGLTLGNNAGTGTATLTVNNATGNGGTFTSSTGGISINKNASVNITEGTFNANGNVAIDGGSLQVGTAGAFKLAAGKPLTAQNSAHVHFTGDPVLGGGSTFSILSGASLIADAALTIANTTNATLSVDGTGSALSAGTDSHWGFFGGIATITFSTNATASVNGNLFLASGGPFSSANVAVLSNAHLTTTSLTMANLGSQTVATLTVAGTGSSVTVTSGMTIGAPSLSTATLFINSGGTFTMQAGVDIIAATGIVNINGGSFIANTGLSDQGALNIGNGGTAGSYVGTASIGVIGSLTFNRSNALTLNTPLQSTGTITQAGTGTTTLTGAYTATGPVKITAGKLVFGSTNAPRQTSGVVIKMQSLTMGSTQVLDMTNHDLIIGNTSYATVQNEILSAFGAASGPAITTSTSNVLGTGPDNTLPIPIDPAAFGLTSWDNVNITDPNSMIVKYTIFGDVTLDGVVNGDDYSVLAGNFGQTTPGASNIIASWLLGDVTLDGVVNGDDYSVLAGNFGEGTMGTLDAPATVSGGGGTSAVPEPAGLFLLGLGCAAITRRKIVRHSATTQRQ